MTSYVIFWFKCLLLRKRTLEQTGMFLKQNPGEAHLSINELREMAENNDVGVFMSNAISSMEGVRQILFRRGRSISPF